MIRLQHANFSMFLAFILAIALLSSCGSETKKPDNSSSDSNEETIENVEPKTPTATESSDRLMNLKTKDLIYVWVDKLAIRDKASTRGKAIASVDSDAALVFTGVKSGEVETIVLRGVAYEDLWYKIETTDGQAGWVFGGAVKRQEEPKGNAPISDMKFVFPHFGDFDLSSWENLGTKTEGGEVDLSTTSYKKGNQILEVASSEMGEMYYGYEYKLKDQDKKLIKERSFSFAGDGNMLEEKVKDHATHTEYTRKQTLKKHWYQLNAKPLMVNGNWKQATFE